MRSFALAFSSSRRAPPSAASSFSSANVSRSVTVCRRLRLALGPVSSLARPRSIESCTSRMTSWNPKSRANRSRNASVSEKLWPVSMCSRGKGQGAGSKALRATAASTSESLPPENRIAARGHCAAVSRRMWIASCSRASRWLRRRWDIGVAVPLEFIGVRVWMRQAASPPRHPPAALQLSTALARFIAPSWRPAAVRLPHRQACRH